MKKEQLCAVAHCVVSELNAVERCLQLFVTGAFSVSSDERALSKMHLE